MTKSRIRVAVAQFHAGDDINANLATCIRAIDDAARCDPDIIVLPEFSNHLSWYGDIDHCREVSLDVRGPFLKRIAGKASEIDAHIVVNATVRRGPDKRATGTSLLYNGKGQLLAENDKQVLIGHENDFLAKAVQQGPVIDSEFGRLGLYACMDGVINETPRGLALRGSQLLLNSLNSFASDEGGLHIPVRAAENKIFVAAANKVGPLVPENMVSIISAETGIPEKFLDGAGESQIVGPDGEAVAKASLDREETVYADIDLTEADNKNRPDGTDIFTSRRPEIYSEIGKDPADRSMPEFKGKQEISAALVTSNSDDIRSVARTAREAFGKGAVIVAVPPLYGLDGRPPAEAAALSARAIEILQAACGENQGWIATSLVQRAGSDFQHRAVLVGLEGTVLSQPQIHFSERCAWSKLADKFETLDLPFGRVGLVTSDDSIYPEMFRLLAFAGVEVAFVPVAPLERWELKTGLVERAAENRINLLAPAASGPLGTGFAACLQTDFTVMTPWEERPFDGILSQPEITRAEPGARITMVRLRPASAANKIVSLGTDLVNGRPWKLAGAIVNQG